MQPTLSMYSLIIVFLNKANIVYISRELAIKHCFKLLAVFFTPTNTAFLQKLCCIPVIAIASQTASVLILSYMFIPLEEKFIFWATLLIIHGRHNIVGDEKGNCI